MPRWHPASDAVSRDSPPAAASGPKRPRQSTATGEQGGRQPGPMDSTGRGNPHPIRHPHLSRASWILASSSRSWVSCFLYVVRGHRGLLVFQLVDGLLDLFFSFEQRTFGGSLRGGRVSAQPHQRECASQLAFAVFGGGALLAFTLARIFQHRMFGGQPFLRVERTRWSCAARNGNASSAEMASFLSASAAGSRKRFGPVAGEHRGVLLGARLGSGDDDAVGLAQKLDGTTAGTGHIDDQLPGGGNVVQQRRQLGAGDIRTGEIELILHPVVASRGR